MKFEILNKNSVIEYLLNIKSIVKFFDNDTLEASEIGDGNLNFVYIVKSINNPQKALIVKQAVPYLRCVGEEFPLSRKRMSYEIRALKKFKKIVFNHIPKVYYSNENMSIVVMQYLSNHNILRYSLMKKTIFPNLSEHISTYLANTLFYTSSLHLTSYEKRDLICKFNNKELCKLTEDFVFTLAFMEDKTNIDISNNNLAHKIIEDIYFKEKVLELKYKFMNQTDALLHGDLHTGSIMINKSETFIIDPEFAFVGPFGFDIGALLANFISSYVYHKIITKDRQYKQWLLKTIFEILEMFDEKIFDLWDSQKDSALLKDGYIDDSSLEEYKSNFLKSILQDSVGFAGCKLARRIFGVAGVEEIRGIEDLTLRNQANELIFKIARKFVVDYTTISSVDDILRIIKNAR